MGMVARYPVFIKDVNGTLMNATFGAPGAPYNCGQDCYVNGSRFWGFSQLNIDWDELLNVSNFYPTLCDSGGLSLEMSWFDPVANISRVVAQCPDNGSVGHDPEMLTLTIMNDQWILRVSDNRGWTPSWLWVGIVAVVVCSSWISVAMVLVMVQGIQHLWLLKSMLVSDWREGCGGVSVGRRGDPSALTRRP